MDLDEFKKQMIRDRLEIKQDFGRVLAFIDFANVNNWFAHDRQDWNDRALENNQSIGIDIDKLKSFSDLISDRTRLYYGEDPRNPGSCKFTDALRIVFEGRNVITKDLQRIKHYLGQEDDAVKFEELDPAGKRFVEIRKCNFDVEITVDVVRTMNDYDTLCLFSGDADFVYLNKFLKRRGKQVILIKAGLITTKLRESADLVINAQQIKKEIAQIKTKT